MIRVELFARTETGCVRERNEDAFLAGNFDGAQRGLGPSVRQQEFRRGGMLLAVCDGMGGAAAGDVASRLAADVLFEVVANASPFARADALRATLLEAARATNAAISAHATENPEKQGMGTTMTAATVFAGELYVLHIGDSRAYLKRGRALSQLTTDHSVVGQMLAEGKLTPEQARSYEHRNVLLQALGVQPVISPELVVVPLRAGDELLLCSDGLTGALEDSSVLDLILRYPDPVRCCRVLTESACVQGGLDNITVAFARFMGDGLPPPQGREPIEARRTQHNVS